MVLSDICLQSVIFSVHNNSCYQSVLRLKLTCWPVKGSFFYLDKIDSVILLFGYDINSSDMPHKEKGLNQEYTTFCVYISW